MWPPCPGGSERSQRDHGHAAVEDAVFVRRGARQVDDAAPGSGTIVDGHDHIPIAACQGNADAAAERKIGMGGGQRILVVNVAAAGALAVPAGTAVPGCEAALDAGSVAGGCGGTVVDKSGGSGQGGPGMGIAGDRMDGGWAAEAGCQGGLLAPMARLVGFSLFGWGGGTWSGGVLGLSRRCERRTHQQNRYDDARKGASCFVDHQSYSRSSAADPCRGRGHEGTACPSGAGGKGVDKTACIEPWKPCVINPEIVAELRLEGKDAGRRPDRHCEAPGISRNDFLVLPQAQWVHGTFCALARGRGKNLADKKKNLAQMPRSGVSIPT